MIAQIWMMKNMAMITQKFKKFFKKTRENSKKKSTSTPRRSDCDQFTGCFKYGKHYHIVKNCPLLKEEQGLEQFRNHGRKQSRNSSARRFTKAMMAAWGDTSEEDEASTVVAVAAALMARSETDSDFELVESLSQLKDKVRGLSKAKIEELLLT